MIYANDLFGPVRQLRRDFWHGDCLELMRNIPTGSVDLVVTSPPYDGLRDYNGSLEWSFEVFKSIANQLTRILKEGGVIVWNINDAVVDGSETGTSFRHALYFKDSCYLNIHDTMIYQRLSTPMSGSIRAYLQSFEYMFVLSKGRPKTVNIIRDKPNKYAGTVTRTSKRKVDGTREARIKYEVARFGRRLNIWQFHPNENQGETDHPAIFPMSLANDHIISWTHPGETVLDPFAGSGTTAIAAMNTGRGYICIEKDAEYFRRATERIAQHA